MKNLLRILIVLIGILIGFSFLPQQVIAVTIPYTITTGIPGYRPPYNGITFFETDLTVNFQTGKIILSGQPDGTGNTIVDDAINIIVKGSDNITRTYTHYYNNGCWSLSNMPPADITSYFRPGINQIHVKLFDVCGVSVGSSPLYLANTNAPDPIPAKTPIIIVPGIAASFNFGVWTDKGDTGWDWFPNTKGSWRQFIDSLEKAGYQKDKDYFIAFYDWRKTNDWTDPDPGAGLPAKKYLTEVIDRAKSANPGISKVNVVTHSLGGLVVRSYVESPNYRGDIDKAFLIGSPNSGSIFAYYTWEGGEIPPNWDPVSKSALSVIIQFLSFNFNEAPQQMIHNHMKGIKDLLPVGYDYILINNNPLNWLNMQEINTFLKNISKSQDTSSIFANKGVKLTNISGTGQTTWEKLQAENYLHQYLWKDGKPMGSFSTADGDNTVLTSSSNLPNAEQLSVSGKHANLPNAAASQIFNKLGINYMPSNLAGAPNTVLVAWVASPVSLEVKDSQGNSVGESLIDPAGEMKWVFVENPESDYKINLTGTGNGEYHVGVDYYTDTKTESFQTQGTAVNGAELDYNLHLDTQNNQVINLEPEDKIPPTTNSQIQGTQGNNNWYVSDVNISLIASDNTGGTGVDKTEYSFDNATWQKYQAPLTVSNEGAASVYYRSYDLIGNKEQTQKIDLKIDKTPPEAKISVDPDIDDLVVKGIDQNQISTQHLSDVVYLITDEAGNTLIIEIRDRDKIKQDRFKIYSLQYNNNPKLILDDNYFNVSYTGKKTRLNINEQNFELKGEIKIRIQYDAKNNKSTIIVTQQKQERIKEIKSGLIFLNLNTNKGQLEATY